MKALVVDDDLALADVVSFTLRRGGYEVVAAHDGLTALERWESESPDIIVLDLNLPKLDGWEVCRRIRLQDNTPIIMLTVRGGEDDIVQGLKLGADDYIVKPFSPRQLLARVEAVLRRSSIAALTPGPLSAGSLTLDISRHQITRDDELLAKLTPLENRLLEVLMINQGQVLTAESLIDHVWGPGMADKAMLKQLIYRLRNKIEFDSSAPRCLETVPGVGYSLTEHC
ncbi:MAG: response regulator transcription factor [Chloroflexi bacterium]|jgi:DNA-binding response OmpR family regulator|nr:response regulator transcription factor [Chloroflexota bacterium]